MIQKHLYPQKICKENWNIYIQCIYVLKKVNGITDTVKSNIVVFIFLNLRRGWALTDIYAIK